MVTGSLAQQYLMSLGIPRRRIFLLPYAVDNNTFARVAREARGCRGEIRRILGIPVFARVVLAVVKFVSREGILDLLQAFAKITEDVPSVWLLVVGDGPLREEVARFIDAYHLERVLCIGYQPYSVLPRLYAISDLFVHPAREESWGVSVNEAMACGVPVLASDRVGAAFDLVRDFQTGLIFRAGDASDLAAKLRVFLALSDEERSLMGVAAQAEVAKWGYEIVEDELRRLLSYFSRRPA
jgi:glycosyltransferase involved in cell wall biosynthesis